MIEREDWNGAHNTVRKLVVLLQTSPTLPMGRKKKINLLSVLLYRHIHLFRWQWIKVGRARPSLILVLFVLLTTFTL